MNVFIILCKYVIKKGHFRAGAGRGNTEFVTSACSRNLEHFKLLSHEIKPVLIRSIVIFFHTSFTISSGGKLHLSLILITNYLHAKIFYVLEFYKQQFAENTHCEQ